VAKKETIRNNLKADEYWEWRTTITELELSRQKLLTAQQNLKLMQKDSELLTARIQLFSRSYVKDAEIALDQAKLEYERFKKVLEENLNQSLNNKAIDDITFEIRELPSNNN
jgi:hypothetical protein